MYHFMHFFSTPFVNLVFSFPLASWYAWFGKGCVKNLRTTLQCYPCVTFPLILRIKLNGALQNLQNDIFLFNISFLRFF